MEKPEDKEAISSFQALMVSTASRVGTENIVGGSSAICTATAMMCMSSGINPAKELQGALWEQEWRCLFYGIFPMY